MGLLTRISVTVAIVLTITSPVVADKTGTDVDRRIKAFLTSLMNDWHDKDLDGAMEHIANSKKVVFIDVDEEMVGYQAIRDFIRRDMRSPIADSLEFKKIRLEVQGDVAWFAARCLLKADKRKKEPDMIARWTGVLNKTKGKWLLVQYHFSLPVNVNTK